MSALRQALGLSLVFLLILAAAGIATLLLVRWELANRTEASLQSDLTAVAEMLNEQNPEDIARLDRDSFVIVGQNGAGMFGKQGRSILEITGFSTREIDVRNGPDQTWRILVADREGVRIAVGRSVSAEEEVLELIGAAFIWAGLISALVTLASGLWIGLAAQRRVSRISAVLDRVAAGTLSARIGPNPQGDDLDIVALKIDSTTAELERSMDQLRHMSSNIAHDLRTPLARLRARLESALAAPAKQSGEMADGIDQALGQVDQIIETFNALLRIARIETGARKSAFRPVDLTEVVRDMAETYGPVVEDGGRTLKTEIDAHAPIDGDRELLVQLVANLIQNAIRHTPQGSDITLGVRQNRLFVTDTGPGIAASDREKVLQPLFRLESSRSSDGAGLGLALVRAVADLHDARLTLADNERAPSGLTVLLAFPTVPSRLSADGSSAQGLKTRAG